jgi:hypothetical protein
MKGPAAQNISMPNMRQSYKILLTVMLLLNSSIVSLFIIRTTTAAHKDTYNALIIKDKKFKKPAHALF